jgi:predicted nucleic acid-binding protein
LIAYLDSSVLVRAYLRDQVGHLRAVELLQDPEDALITGTWTRIETSVRSGSPALPAGTRLRGPSRSS